MKPSELAHSVPLSANAPKDARTLMAIAFRYAADNFYIATMENGKSRPLDPLEFKAWLAECAEAFSLADSHVSIPAADSGAPRRLRSDGSTGSRYDRGDFCNRCGHVHQGRVCGMKMGGGPECRCELEGVPA